MHAFARDEEKRPSGTRQGFFSTQKQRLDNIRDSIDEVLAYADCSHTAFERKSQAWQNRSSIILSTAFVSVTKTYRDG